jgi:hypothetical protein
VLFEKRKEKEGVFHAHPQDTNTRLFTQKGGEIEPLLTKGLTRTDAESRRPSKLVLFEKMEREREAKGFPRPPHTNISFWEQKKGEFEPLLTIRTTRADAESRRPSRLVLFEEEEGEKEREGVSTPTHKHKSSVRGQKEGVFRTSIKTIAMTTTHGRRNLTLSRYMGRRKGRKEERGLHAHLTYTKIPDKSKGGVFRTSIDDQRRRTQRPAGRATWCCLFQM